ncbi:hypothetical protein [Natrinema sp. 1APR25-10V2]|nr:hypothetical protein [Natrinema sp. 1APR25-10V2]
MLQFSEPSVVGAERVRVAPSGSRDALADDPPSITLAGRPVVGSGGGIRE